MKNDQTHVWKKICAEHGKDRTRLMDIVRDVQAKCSCISDEAMDAVAAELNIHRVEVESMVSFYAFLSSKPKGKITIRLCNDIVDQLQGEDKVAKAFTKTLGIGFGETTADGRITLEHAPCIGMSDQAPAAMINDTVVTNLTADKARDIASTLMAKPDEAALTTKYGDGNNANDLVRSMVSNNIRRKDAVIFADFQSGTALSKALALSPAEVIRDVKTARLRGRGGAGFPTGMKWDFTRQAAGKDKYVICNADEGEPGTFKDRVILTECPDLMFEGMTIAGYAIGAGTGIIYLRAEYAYLQAFLEATLVARRKAGLLGKDICGRKDFSFDIRIQMGAGAYVCGEETSLISSCEGLRGDPKNRPPFPAQKGYLASPTSVNNVETFCCVSRILDKGPGWFAQMGSKGSPGTKLLSISGDCKNPGVYEVPFGIKISEMLKMAGAEKVQAVQVGGPSGSMIGPASFERTICYDDLSTGGSMIIFNESRNILDVALYFMDFFVDESCGHCTPCRVGNVLIRERLVQIIKGMGEEADLQYLATLGKTVKLMSRCGLGQTSPNPVLSTIKEFPDVYNRLLKKRSDGHQPSFDIHNALKDGESLASRKSEVYK